MLARGIPATWLLALLRNIASLHRFLPEVSPLRRHVYGNIASSISSLSAPIWTFPTNVDISPLLGGNLHGTLPKLMRDELSIASLWLTFFHVKIVFGIAVDIKSPKPGDILIPKAWLVWAGYVGKQMRVALFDFFKSHKDLQWSR